MRIDFRMLILIKIIGYIIALKADCIFPVSYLLPEYASDGLRRAGGIWKC